MPITPCFASIPVLHPLLHALHETTHHIPKASAQYPTLNKHCPIPYGRDLLWPIPFWSSILAILVFARPVLAKTIFCQYNFGQSNQFGPIHVDLVCVSWWDQRMGPKPRKSGPRELGRRMVFPKFRAFFPFLPTIFIYLPSLGVFSWNLVVPSNVLGFRAREVHIGRSQRLINTTKFHEKTPREREKERNGWPGKQRDILGGLAQGVRCRAVQRV